MHRDSLRWTLWALVDVGDHHYIKTSRNEGLKGGWTGGRKDGLKGGRKGGRKEERKEATSYLNNWCIKGVT